MPTTVEGADVRDAMRQLHANDHSQSYVSIDPIIDWNRDEGRRLPEGCKAIPTVRFTVRWHGRGESFMREVDSVEELFAVLKPIFAEHKKAKKIIDKETAVAVAESRARSIEHFEKELEKAQRNLENARGK